MSVETDFVKGWTQYADKLVLTDRIRASLPAATILATRLVDENSDEVTEAALVESTLRIAKKLAIGADDLAATTVNGQNS